MFRAIPIWVLAAAMFVAGCDRSSVVNRTGSDSQNTNQQIFQVRGVIMELKPLEKSVVIKHEEVPDYMPAMTMPFDVRDTNELAELDAGDPVTFRLLVTDTEGWIDQIRKTGPKTNSPPTTGPFRLVRDVEVLNPGDPMPDYSFTNQFGKLFSTRDFKGQALAIEFLFTRCPLPTFCPFLANSFGATQKQLLALPNAPTNWHLLTISFDPEFDTPAILKTYAERHQYNPAHWTFATGALIDITAIGDQFGLTFWREDGSISHNLRAVVIDATGRVRKVFVGNEWKPEELVMEMLKAAAAK
jgi:protein SCO1